MAIRPATESDVPVVRSLLRAYCDFYAASPSESSLERMVWALIAAPDHEGFLLVAEDDESAEVVGLAACGWKWSSLRAARVVVLEDLFVAEAARGRGHADALIAATAEIARRHGAPAVTWLTREENYRARAVYDRAGGRSEPFLEYELKISPGAGPVGARPGKASGQSAAAQA
jgi:GNAT superfamily N-acetyltransferase